MYSAPLLFPTAIIISFPIPFLLDLLSCGTNSLQTYYIIGYVLEIVQEKSMQEAAKQSKQHLLTTKLHYIHNLKFYL